MPAPGDRDTSEAAGLSNGAPANPSATQAHQELNAGDQARGGRVAMPIAAAMVVLGAATAAWWAMDRNRQDGVDRRTRARLARSHAHAPTAADIKVG